MYCNYCGKSISDDAKFCSFCGKETIINNTSAKNEPRRKNCWDYFIDVVKTVYHYTVDGKCSMAKYWSFALFHFVFFTATLIPSSIFTPLKFIPEIYSGFMALPLLSLSIKRIHDTGNSGWKVFIPVYNLILLLTKGETSNVEYVNEVSEKNTSERENTFNTSSDTSESDASK